jgi:hypothetical protein
MTIGALGFLTVSLGSIHGTLNLGSVALGTATVALGSRPVSLVSRTVALFVPPATLFFIVFKELTAISRLFSRFVKV